MKKIQQQIINQEWAKIVSNDKDLPETPKISNAIQEDAFKEKFLKRIEFFKNKTEDFIDKFLEYKKEYLFLKENYAEGRMAKNSNNLLYYAFLFILVVLEVPTNYSTINNILHKPAISLFGTIAIGFILVFIAHYHGKFFKQLKFIIQTPDMETSVHVQSRKMQIIIFLGSLVVLGAIFYMLYYIRLQYFYDMLGAELEEDMLAGSKLFTKVLTLMAINGVIYLLGVVASYIHADPIPGYQEIYKKMEKFKKKIRKEYDKLVKELYRIENRYKEK